MLLALVSALLIFLILVFCTFFPYCYLIHRTRSEERRLFSLSICNCIACGIFLSTCFLGLIPHVHRHEDLIRQRRKTLAVNNSSNHSEADFDDLFLSSELVVLLGFLIILFTEQMVLACSGNSATSKTSPIRGGNPPSMRSLLEGEAEDGHPLVDTTLDDNDDGVQDIVFRSSSPLEYGHPLHSHVAPPKDGISARTLFLLFGLSTHSLFEGIALGVQHDKDDFMNILVAIMFHEVLCCIAYGVSMAQQYTPLRAALPTVLILSASIPAGMIIAIMVEHINSDSLMLRFILEGLAAGTFVYVACVEMLSAELGHSHAHSHSAEPRIRDRTPQSPYQGVGKALAVGFGVFLFWSLKFVRVRHN